MNLADRWGQADMARRSHRSLGELISSFSFLLVGVYFGLSAPELWAEGQAVKAVLLGVSAGLCVLAAMRFQLQNIWESIRRWRK